MACLRQKHIKRFGRSGRLATASRVFCRSLYVVKDMKKGGRFTPENVRSIRPGYGLPPKHLDEILGQKAQRDLARGTALDWSMVAGPEG